MLGKGLCILTALLGTVNIAKSQGLNRDTQPIEVRGVIVDSLSGEFIADVHVLASGKGMISNNKGEFTIGASPGEQIFFSHVAYVGRTIYPDLGWKDKFIIVRMASRVTHLREYTFRAPLTEDEFRAKIIKTAPVVSTAKRIARENGDMIRAYARFAPPPTMTKEDRFFEYMKGAQGTTIFSSDPSKGLIKAIKNIVAPEVYSLPERDVPYDPQYKSRFKKMILMPRDSAATVASDTLATDSVKSVLKE